MIFEVFFSVISKLVCNKIQQFSGLIDDNLLIYPLHPITIEGIKYNRLIEEAHVSQQVKSEQHYSVAFIVIKFTCIHTHTHTDISLYQSTLLLIPSELKISLFVVSTVMEKACMYDFHE